METPTLTPASLDLPKKFDRFWPSQIAALEAITASQKKVVLLQAPTGTGKTLIMAALGKMVKEQVVYTCHTKQLQGQVVKDFPYAVELKGRSNYSCVKGRFTCAECTKQWGNVNRARCRECGYTSCSARDSDFESETCPCASDCPYLQQKALAKASDLAILNNAFFLTEANYVGDFSGWPWVVLDEGDMAEKALMSFIEVTITAARIEQLRLGPPRRKTVAEAWFEWASDEAIPAIQRRLQDLEDAATLFDIREQQELQRLLSKLFFLTRQNLSNWAFIPLESSWTFKPVFISRYASDYLWEHGERFLVMSASILSSLQFARDLGLSRDDVEFIDMPSSFPPERRPIYFTPEADMTYKNREEAWPRVVEAVDRVLEEHPQEKGLIHTVSYPLARYLFENSRHPARLLQHDSFHRVAVLEQFKEDSRPLVLISPSMDRGVDLPDDFCRFLILVKVPFPSLRDIQVSRRLYSAADGATWYAVQTIRTIVQATGRGMRSEDDYCVSYILDKQFQRVFCEYNGLFPEWWKAAVTPRPQLPPPAARAKRKRRKARRR